MSCQAASFSDLRLAEELDQGTDHVDHELVLELRPMLSATTCLVPFGTFSSDEATLDKKIETLPIEGEDARPIVGVVGGPLRLRPIQNGIRLTVHPPQPAVGDKLGNARANERVQNVGWEFSVPIEREKVVEVSGRPGLDRFGPATLPATISKDLRFHGVWKAQATRDVKGRNVPECGAARTPVALCAPNYFITAIRPERRRWGRPLPSPASMLNRACAN